MNGKTDVRETLNFATNFSRPGIETHSWRGFWKNHWAEMRRRLWLQRSLQQTSTSRLDLHTRKVGKCMKTMVGVDESERISTIVWPSSGLLRKASRHYSTRLVQSVSKPMPLWMRWTQHPNCKQLTCSGLIASSHPCPGYKWQINSRASCWNRAPPPRSGGTETCGLGLNLEMKKFRWHLCWNWFSWAHFWIMMGK